MILSYFHGRTPTDLLNVHNQYGPVVRIGPNELSYIDPLQWREIYGYKARGEAEFPKDHRYHAALKGDPVILNADREYHGYIRKLLAHGFSEKSLREQEPVLKEYIDTLIHKLHKECQNGEQPLNIATWYNFLIFDFVGALTFGESFNCLNSGTPHPWVREFFNMVKPMAYYQISSRMPYLLRVPFERYFIPGDSKGVMSAMSSVTKVYFILWRIIQSG
ncbi:hypothetical protein ONZ43_g5358 [Nemania bipapillata]|uniref:Uncharacterized protein n=1 Tax=Nemania bipapillata TaxID=110536 RepID=A0ACC2IBN5_9PEZI|nr:hypothetical protein ONZ43_g5358 [Nemania bipapillata]